MKTGLRMAAVLGWAVSAGAADTNGNWQSLFDGRTLAGWSVRCHAADRDKEFWTVRDGAIECDSIGKGKHNYVWLMTDRTFADFELELEFQAFRDSPGNSGVQVRSRYDTAAGAPGGGWLDGPQIDIHPPQPWRTGFIYDETRTTRRWIHPSRPNSSLDKQPAPPGWSFRYADEGGAWNTLRIVCRGTTIRTWLNGTAVSDFDGRGLLDDEGHQKHRVGLDGHIALQLHTGDQLRMRFRNIRLRALPKTGVAELRPPAE